MSRRALPAVLLAAAAAGCFARSYRSMPRVAIVDGDPIVQMAKPGKLPSLIRPRLVPADRRFDVPEAETPVLGLVLEDSPRAYPVGLLDRYEVVNDSAPGTPFVVARCALTGVAAAYDRRAGGATLLFENSGALWRDTLVLRDRETGTYWSAATGRALSGPLAGAALARIPAAFARLRDWERTFPQSLYLDEWKPTSAPVLVQIYGLSPWQGVSGETTNDSRYKAKQQVFVVAEAGEALAFTAAELEGKRQIVARLGGRAVLLQWDARLRAPRAWAEGDERAEIAVMPMYWFAVGRHFAVVRTPADKAANGETRAVRN
jgi:hypothetical protein